MTQLPLQPRLDHYRGTNLAKQRKAADWNTKANKIAHHINTLIANNPAQMQQYNYYSIAADLGISEEHVARAIMYGGSNGITVGVEIADRNVLMPYKST